MADADFVKVAWARNQAEAELIQGLLSEEGVPSMLRRTGGFDVPDFLAAGPRDVVVPAAAVETARDVLLESQVDPFARTPDARPAPGRLLLGLLIAVAAVAIVAWLVATLAA